MISTKVAVSISILVAIACTGALAIALDYQARERRQEFRETTVDSLQLLAISIAPSVASDRHDRVQTVLDNIAIHPERFPDIQSLGVVNRDGRIVADLDPRRYNLKRYNRGGSRDYALTHAITRPLGSELLEVVIPVRITYPLGVMHATISEKRLSAALANQQEQAVLLVLGTATILAVALYLVLRRLLGYRIVKLAMTATTLRQGQMDARAEVDGHDEISQLAESFNRMADAIKAYTDDLERLVAERTAALQQANDRLAQLAITDPLTALFNRRHFEERASRDLEVARRAQRPFALVVMDVDRFKQVNDRYGHLVGDMVLKGVGGVLLENARAADLAARIGGEEFAIAMPDAGAEEAIQAAERIRRQLEGGGPPSSPELDGQVVTASFGIAAYPEHGDTLRVLMSAADAALYRAKQAGRNKVEQAAMPRAEEAS